MSQLKLLELPSPDAKVAHGTPIQLARSARVATSALGSRAAVTAAACVLPVRNRKPTPDEQKFSPNPLQSDASKNRVVTLI